MARKSHASASRDRLLAIVNEYGVRGAARKLGIDRRTVQRQLNQGQQATATKQKIVHEAARVKRFQQKRADIEIAKQAGQEKIKLPFGVRVSRTERLDPSDPKRKRRLPGYTLRFGARNLSIPDLARLIQSLHGKGRNFFLIKEMSAGTPIYAGVREYHGRRYERREHEASMRYRVDDPLFSDSANLQSKLADELLHGRLLYLMVTDTNK